MISLFVLFRRISFSRNRSFKLLQKYIFRTCTKFNSVQSGFRSRRTIFLKKEKKKKRFNDFIIRIIQENIILEGIVPLNCRSNCFRNIYIYIYIYRRETIASKSSYAQFGTISGLVVSAICAGNCAC